MKKEKDPWDETIKPPPSNIRCDCCGKHISELKPFGKAGDPLVGDFDGALLVKAWRREIPPDEDADKEYDEAYRENPEDPRAWLSAKYGQEKAEDIHNRSSAASIIGSWRLCRDCIIMEQKDFWDRFGEVHKEEINI
jgi:hypothetical protein